jgi:hypothetical protein
MRLVLPLAQHGASNLNATVNRQTKAANEGGCEQARFYWPYPWPSNGHACLNSGAVWRIRNSEGVAAP